MISRNNLLGIKNENKIFNNIFENVPNLTLIAVSHKLETIRNFDKLFLMEDKKIINLSYENLLQNQKSKLIMKIGILFEGTKNLEGFIKSSVNNIIKL